MGAAEVRWRKSRSERCDDGFMVMVGDDVVVE